MRLPNVLQIVYRQNAENIQCMWMLSQVLMMGTRDSKREALLLLEKMLNQMERTHILSFKLTLQEKNGFFDAEEKDRKREKSEKRKPDENGDILETSGDEITVVEVLRKCLLLQFEEKNFHQAARLASKAILLQPEDPHLHYFLGRSIREVDKDIKWDLNKDALSSFNTAIALGPVSDSLAASTYYSLGLCYRQSKNMEETERCFRKAVKISPTNLEYSLSLGRLLAELGKYEESFSVCRKIRDSIADSGKLHLAIIQTNKLKGDLMEEARAWEHFLDVWIQEGSNPLFMNKEESLQVCSTLLNDVKDVVRKNKGFDFLLAKAQMVLENQQH